MKRIISLLLCILMLSSLVIPSVSAAIFQVSYYEEEIYAGGVMDLYAFPRDGGVEPFTYQWQAKGYGWIDLEDNESYKGTKTNHLQIYTKTGDYGDFSQIPFQCAVTDAEGTTFYTPSICPDIYPTANLIPNMRNWGYGLYEPTLTNVKNLTTSDNIIYTGTAYAGSKIDLFVGSKPVEDKEILRNSEVKLTREIYITEYGHTTKTTDKTTYIPYTIGTVKVEFKLNLKIGDTDLGTFDTKTVNITTSKPDAITRGVTKKECSMLRYPYNESETLGSLPQGAVVEVLGKDGGYYQVYVRSVISYIPEGLLRVDEPVGEAVIKNVDVTITEPAAGEKPTFTCNVLTTGCELYKTEPVTWYDQTAKEFLSTTDKFIEGHSYNLSIWISAKEGYKFQIDASGNPKLTGSINGNLPPFINKAYEQDPEEVIELTYTFNNVKAKEPEQTHTCAPVLVKRVEPTCTENGHEAYYYCSCGMHYADAAGTQVVNTSIWGVIPATGHTPSGWRITQVYHYKVCTSCGDMLQDEDHEGGSTTCVAGANCIACGYEYTQPNENHTPDTSKWTACGNLYHAHLCKLCGAHCDPQDHIPGPAATDTTPQTCTVCNFIIVPAKNHTHQLTHMPYVPATCLATGTVEHYSCSGCSALFADKDGKELLPEGTSVIIPYLTHIASEDWTIDETFHWRTCSLCQTVLEEAKLLHDGQDGKCATCGYVIGSGDTNLGTAPAEPTPSPDKDKEQDHKEQYNKGQDNNSWTAILLVGLVCFAAAMTVTVIILKKKENKRGS